MATLKQRLHRKNSSGSYDVIHFETEAALIIPGTFSGNMVAKSGGAVGTAMIRNIKASTTDIGAGASLPTGDIYLVYE